MSAVFAFFTFINAWWIMMFVAIPLSVKYSEETESSVPAHEKYVAAPKEIYWKKAFFIASLLALLVTGFLALVIESGIVSVKDSLV